MKKKKIVHIIENQYIKNYLTNSNYTAMHDLKSIYNKVEDSISLIAKEYFDHQGNSKNYSHSPKLSDLQIVSLAITSECLQIDSESLLWSKLKTDYNKLFPNLPHRATYNRRRRNLANLISQCNNLLSDYIYEAQPDSTLIIDSMPIPVCKIVRERSSTVCRKEQDEVKARKGRNIIMGGWFIGYKLHLITTSTGIYRDMMITGANVHDSYYLKVLNAQDEHLMGKLLLGDRGYLGQATQLRLFEEVDITLDVPYRRNQKDYVKYDYAKKIKRKQIEVVFSQLCDEFVIRRNYAKTFNGLYARIISKLAAKTFKQYWNLRNNKKLNQTKHALAA
jgi:hypothetical protein